MGTTTLRRLGRLSAALVFGGMILLATAGTALAAGVTMQDNDFSPGNVTIAAGESVTFSNSGDSPHTATADDGSFDTGTVESGSSATVTFDSAGTFRYYCQFHGGPGGSGMSGVITVTGSGGGSGGGNAGGSGGSGAGGGGTAEQDAPTLPQTATPLPFIAAAGGLLLVSGLVIGRRRATR
jgi:LPXTG-motif cell wall-anchored protein